MAAVPGSDKGHVTQTVDRGLPRARLAGTLLVVGMIVFWIGAFVPKGDVYPVPGEPYDVQTALDAIASHRAG